MDILFFAQDKLRAIQKLYDEATAPFVETKARIEAGIAPYDPPPFDPETDDLEPPFMEEWGEAGEFQDLIGQMCLSLVHSCLKDYLDGAIERNMAVADFTKYVSQRKNRVKGQSWFTHYIAFLAEVWGIDFSQCPVATESLEEINLARNDIQHGRAAFGFQRYRDEQHKQRFPRGLFIPEHERDRLDEHLSWSSSRIHVSPTALTEAIRRVDEFCKFPEDRIS